MRQPATPPSTFQASPPTADPTPPATPQPTMQPTHEPLAAATLQLAKAQPLAQELGRLAQAPPAACVMQKDCALSPWCKQNSLEGWCPLQPHCPAPQCMRSEPLQSQPGDMRQPATPPSTFQASPPTAEPTSPATPRPTTQPSHEPSAAATLQLAKAQPLAQELGRLAQAPP